MAVAPLTTILPQIPQDVERVVVGFLGAFEISVALRIHRLCRQNSLLLGARSITYEDKAAQLEGWDSEIITVFRRENISLWRLREFIMSRDRFPDGRVFKTMGNITRPEYVSVMRVRDAQGQLGLVVNLQGRDLPSYGSKFPLKELFIAIYIHQWEFNEKFQWRISGEEGRESFRGAHIKVHEAQYAGTDHRCDISNPECPNLLPTSQRTLEVLRKLLRGEDSCFTLTGRLEMVARLLPSATAPVPAAAAFAAPGR